MARKISIVLSILGILMFLGGTIYFIIGFSQVKNSVSGMEDPDLIKETVQPFLSGMMIWVLGNFIAVTFVNGAAALTSTMRSENFKGDAVFITKVVITFIPVIMCAVYFAIVNSLLP